MATITIRNLDESVKRRLRIRAANHDRSMEEEVRHILQEAVDKPDTDTRLGTKISQRFAEAGGVELFLPERTEMPRKPDMGK